jgi:RNA polymerase sigma-70 factor (ECF subfamily)
MRAEDPHTELVARSREGDARALGRLLEALGPSILRACRAVHAADADAEDAAQESMIQLLRALPGFRAESTIAQFATRIAVRTAMRSRKREREKQERRRDVPPEPTGAPDLPHRELVAARRMSFLRGLVDELPESQAETLVLRVVLGHSLEEVATMTEAPVNTVRSRVRLAKEALARKITADPELLELLEVPS